MNFRKTLSIPLLLCIFSLSCFAQTLSENEITLAFNSKNYLYIGFSNPVELQISGYPLSQLSFSCRNGQVTKDSLLHITPYVSGEVSLKVYKQGDHLKTISYTAVQLPAPKAFVAGKSGGRIRVSELLGAGKVSLGKSTGHTIGQASFFPYEQEFTIVGYTVSTKVRDGYIIDKPSSDCFYTSEIEIFLKSARPGQKIYFESIRARGPQGSIFELGTLLFIIAPEE